ncbi:MAG: 4Fe-4S binding protein [Tissierellia bacterium]|nr:4Fe-4S binding protein [Tissierellia bacterium]
MFKDVLVKTLLGNDFKEKIHFNAQKCLRNNNFKDKCTKCKDICPEKAIENLNSSVKIDEILCTGCGYCVTECYSRSLSMKSNFYAKAYLGIFNSVESTYSCLKKPGDYGINGCFRLMDYKFLSAYKATGVDHNLILDLSECDDCMYKNLNEDFEKDIEKIFLNSENGPRVTLVNEIKVEDTTDSPVSRREFLEVFKNKGTVVKDNFLNDFVEQFEFLNEGETYRDDLNRVVYALLKSRDDIEKYIDSNEYIFTPSINQNCTMCRMCINLCPNGALKIETVNGESSILLDSSKCSFCGLCIEKCGDNAITKGVFKGFDVFTIHTKGVQKCKLCRSKVTKLNANGLCDTCFIRERNRKTKINL